MAAKFERYHELLDAIEFERQEEERYYLSLSADKNIEQRLASGVLWYPVVLNKHNYTVGEYLELHFERVRNFNVPHKLKAGMGCRIFKSDSSSDEFTANGTISFLRKNRISVILKDNGINKDTILNLKGNLCVELIYDERPYRVMKDAIHILLKSDNPRLQYLRDSIAKKEDIGYTKEEPYSITLPYLNDSQNLALNNCLSAEYMSIVHGPPGTGKTTTLVALIKQLLKSDKKILVCAPSNNAVDLLTQRLDEIGVNVLRIGNVTRIGDGISHLTLSEKARNSNEWQHIKKVKIEAEEAFTQAKKYKRNFGSTERANRKAMYGEAKELRSWARDLEDKLLDNLIDSAQVICSTLIGVSHSSVSNLHFSTCVIDEASQALEPETWNAIIRSDRVVLAGDHLQLAPTVKSNKALKMGLQDTLLNRMTDVIKYSNLLNKQYRMNDKILSFSNLMFYDNLLQSDDKNRKWCLENDESPLLIIDTSGCGFEESFNPKSQSRYNEGEYFILREHFLSIQEKLDGVSIGIISPYSEQVKFLNRSIGEEEIYHPFDITVNSIDGFQGQERDVIYICLVRSNSIGEIGFLKDERRLNVAMTRAKKKLVIIGDFSTLSQNSLFNTLADHVEKNGTYKSAWEYMTM